MPTVTEEYVVVRVMRSKLAMNIYCGVANWFYDSWSGFRKTVKKNNCPLNCNCTFSCEYVHMACFINAGYLRFIIST